ncbi:restriction endonuclease subunit S [Crocosphaera sp.]|uniref:restriction endonuclease subunit S n=1 Tax=Crocosphaera sp. TaxID=2729996 RepID=UPI003F262AC1|nr:restriction endonuclease subunit S [Crocosphaera sp.]
MDQLPEGWKLISLNEVIGNTGLFIDGDWIESKDQDPNGEIRLLQLADIGIGEFLNKSSKFLAQDTANQLKCTYLKENDLLVARLPDPIGRCCILPKLNQRCVTAVDVCIIRPDPNLVNRQYLMRLFNSNSMKNLIENYVTGTTRKRISRKNLQRLKIPLPPLEEQKRIAKILDKADEIRGKRKESILLTDELLWSTFLDMFGDPVINPKGWETKTIESITKNEKNAIKRGPFGGALKKEIFINEGYLVYEQYHALNNDFSFERYYIDEHKFEELKGFEVKPGDIIISCSGVYLGKLAIVPEGAKKGIINQALLKISLDQSKITNNFFTFHFRHQNFRDTFFAANRGSGVPNFPPIKDFKTFPFIVPPIDIQNQFELKIKKIKNYQQHINQSLQESENLFNSLLQRAFKGEL